MKTSLLRLLVGVVCCAFLVGCNGSFFSPENAIKAPSATGVYRGVQEALEAFAGKQVVLKYPLVEGKTTAFYPIDLDGDEIQEVLAFYRMPNEGDVTRISLLRSIDGNWSCSKDDTINPDVAENKTTPKGNVVNVDFCDLNHDGKTEIFVGWQDPVGDSLQMGVYSLDPKRITMQHLEPYTKYAFCDIDGNGVQDLCLASLVKNGNDMSSMISFFTIGGKEKKFKKLDALQLDNRALEYGQLQIQAMSNGVPAVYLDVKTADGMVTELVYMAKESGKLYNPFATEPLGINKTNTATFRYDGLETKDLDGDGILEIPSRVKLPAATTHLVPNEKQPIEDDFFQYVIQWNQYRYDVAVPTRTWWYNRADGYYLEIAPELFGKYRVEMDPNGRCTFLSADETEGSKKLFHVKRYTVSEFALVSGVTELYKDDAYVWAVAVETDVPLQVTTEAIKQAFHLIAK
ncbi:MAG: VCBS repeat-containing protein [Clostridia bacterium]|nr:VCBS repeat-containing protein [Clostridia bacterium]